MCCNLKLMQIHRQTVYIELIKKYYKCSKPKQKQHIMQLLTPATADAWMRL